MRFIQDLWTSSWRTPADSRAFAMYRVGGRRFAPCSVYHHLVLLCFLAYHVRLGVAFESTSKEDYWSNKEHIVTDSEMTNCWQHRDFLDLDPDWSNIRSSAGHQQPQQKSHHHPKQQHWPLPELEPLRLEMRLHHKHQASKLHQVAVRMSLPFGGTARLPCPVRQLGNKTVSWMKHSMDSVQLLTVGNSTYSNDNRLAVTWRYPGNWTLQITSIELTDSGCYQCQVNTHPAISLFVYLQVQGPAVTIVDERNISISEAVFKSGALIRLLCQVRQADRDNFILHWKLGSSVLNHDTQRGGISVKTERQGRDAVSWLMMVKASSRDSGIYTCSVDNKSQAIVSVHVIQGEQQAAVQELTGMAVRHFSLWILLLLIGHAILY